MRILLVLVLALTACGKESDYQPQAKPVSAAVQAATSDAATCAFGLDLVERGEAEEADCR